MTGASQQSDARISLRWQGPLFAHQSISIVNRELCRQLARRNEVQLTIDAGRTGSVVGWNEPESAWLSSYVDVPLSAPADVHVTHDWPPNEGAPPEGRWAMVSAWDAGSLPEYLLDPTSHAIDEVWATSQWVRESYLRAGVAPERVVVIPHGIDPERYRPNVKPLWLPTEKRCKLLFVGGTVTRKGADILLDTYVKTFGPADDVCLIMKDFGSETFYRGQGIGEQIRAARADTRNPEILYLDATLPPALMPSLYAAADCLVQPYRGEGFCLPILEAMACGRPAIVPQHGAALDYCDESTAYLIPTREVRSKAAQWGDYALVDYVRWAEVDRDLLGQAMRAVVAEPELARARGEQASARAHQDYSWSRVADLVVERLMALVQRPIRRFQPS